MLAHPRTTTLVLLASIGAAVLCFMFGRIGSYVAVVAWNFPLSTEFFLNGFDNPRFFGQMQTLTLPLLALPLLARDMRLRYRAAAALILAAWWMLCWLSGTRGTWYALLITGVAAAALLGAKGRRYALLQAGAAGAGFALYWLLFSMVPAWLGGDVGGVEFERSGFTLSMREQLWQLAFEQIRLHPWLGIGPMHFAAGLSTVGAHPHNLPLQLAVEWGVPAAGLFLFALAWCVLQGGLALRRQAPSADDWLGRPLDLVLLVAIAAALVQSLVDGILVVPYSEVLLMVLVGFAWGRVLARQQSLATPARSWRAVAAVLILTSAAVLAVGTWVQSHDLEARIALQEQYPGPLKPRYWSAGWIGEPSRWQW